jgi:glutathione S-transferase/alpha,alpha-trehalase
LKANKLSAVLSNTALFSNLKLFGSSRSRSPLVNWYLYENNVPFEELPPYPSNHPFKQIPFLTDVDENDIKVEVFESGAILLYIADKYVLKNDASTPAERAKYAQWIFWANSELDKICFGYKQSGTTIDQPTNEKIKLLEAILSKNEWLVDNKFSVADVAVASYLNYVPIFFKNVNLTLKPNIVRYMQKCAKRPFYEKAFGYEHAALIIEKSNKWLSIS